jgi:hypothetical protein
MGGMDDMKNKANEYADKAKGARRQGQGQEQGDEGMQRPGQDAPQRSGGRIDEQAERGQGQSRQRMDQESNEDMQDDWS